MKTKLFLASLLIVISTLNALSQNAQNFTVKADIQMTENHQIRIWLLDAQNEKIALKIFDDSGVLLLKKSYRTIGNMKLIVDAKHLTDGDYTIEITRNDEMINTKQIKISDGNLCSITNPDDNQNNSLAIF